MIIRIAPAPRPLTTTPIMQLMKLTENIKITQSEIIENALMYSLDIFQGELNKFGRVFF